MPRSALLLCLLATADASVVAAEAPVDLRPLDTVTISATRLRGVAGFDVPASVEVIRLAPDNNRAEVNVSEALSGTAGVSALDRQNYAQDTQLSIRGFGARSTFGVRGVRLFSDGIPASMPDGQGQLSHFSLAAGERIEVMRGPFSSLYGNSSGGVVQLWSRDGADGGPSRVKASAGSSDAHTLTGELLGNAGIFGYNLAASRFKTEGFRDHSAARRDSLHAKLGLQFGDTRRLDLVLNYLDLPQAQDPLGLTGAAYRQNPQQVAPVATQFNTRKSVRQEQGGLIYEQGLGMHTLRLMAYGGRRKIEQFLALPVASQSNPLNSGGVVNLETDYGGADLRWSWQGQLADRPFELTVGGNFDLQEQQRRGYENFSGTTLGVRGQLRRDERNRVRNFDQFAQAWWQFAQRWALLAGVRHSEVQFRSRDHYVITGNPDDSGGVDYGNTTPVAGLMFSAADNLRLYLSAGRGFETPTFNELGYRADGQAGLAFDLVPAVSDNIELGTKWRAGRGISVAAALFRANTDDELAVVRNVGGRSSYRNVGRARRQGFEASLEAPLASQLQLQMSYTLLDASFRSAYLVCTVPGCTTPNVPVAAGSRIPGVARHHLFGRLQWQGSHWSAAVESVVMSRIVVNDIATESAAGYALLHLEAARSWDYSAGSLRTFARLENALDRSYIGSVIVNEGNSRFFEPGPDRAFLLGVQWRWP